MLRSIIIFLFAVVIAVPAFGQSADSDDRKWSLKYGVGGAFLNNFSMELERDGGEKTAFTFRGAITNPIARPDTVGADGFFLKAGVKFYFGEGHAGFAVKPEAVYRYRKNINFISRASTGIAHEHSFGALMNLSYTWKIGGRVVIEPHLGIGFIPTWEVYNAIDDVTLEILPTRWTRIERDEDRSYFNSHYAIRGSGAISGGINIGFTF